MRILKPLFFLSLFFATNAWCAPQYTLQDLIDIAKRENPILDVLKAREDAAPINEETIDKEIDALVV